MTPTSIIIPAFNARRWLPATLASVASQEGVEWEVIIVDDGSTDGTADYVEKEWPRFRLIRTENFGVSHARNLGTSTAVGEFIQYLDADDLLLPGKLKRQVRLLSSNPTVDAIYSNWQRLNEQDDGHFLLGEKVCRKFEDIDVDPEIAFFSSMWCPTGAYLFRRSFLNRILPWKDWLPVIQDARFAWDAAAAGARWLHDPDISVLYRQHRSGSVSTTNRRAFLLDCAVNIDDIKVLWDQRGELTPSRREALIGGYENVMRGLYVVDTDAFLRVYQRLLQLEPGYLPSHRGLRWISRFIGYENAERIAQAWRWLKAVSA
jgi:glycosyltransferase involved in cell wall biosynthesis